jgi:hypothetical protein
VALGLGDAPEAVAVDAQPALDRLWVDALRDLGLHQADHRALVLADAVARRRLARPHRLAELQQQVEWDVRLLGHLFERVLGGRGEPLVQREVVEVERKLVPPHHLRDTIQRQARPIERPQQADPPHVAGGERPVLVRGHDLELDELRHEPRQDLGRLRRLLGLIPERRRTRRGRGHDADALTPSRSLPSFSS